MTQAFTYSISLASKRMLYSGLLLFLSTIFIFDAQAVAQPTFLGHFCNHTASKTYQANLNHVLCSLHTNYGFNKSSYGQKSDKVYAIGLCRGDVKPGVCHGCLKNATSLFKHLCPNQKEAIGWLDYCMLRYSNRPIFGLVETDQTIFVWNQKNISTQYAGQFNRDVTRLLGSLMSQAAAGGPLRKFAINSARGPNNLKIYGLVQCLPDLSKQKCSRCFAWALNAFPLCSNRRMGGRVLGPSCNFRYEVEPFYDKEAYASSPSSVAMLYLRAFIEATTKKLYYY